MASKRLIFESDNLGDDVTLKLFLTPRVQDLFAKPPPISWRETTLCAAGSYGLDVTWNARMVFSLNPQGAMYGRAVSAATSVPIEIGQETTLTEKYPGSTNGPPTYSFTKPVSREGLHPAVKAINDTGRPVSLSLGFITEQGTADAVVHPNATWERLGQGSCVTGTIEPILRAYVALKHQQTGWLSGGSGTDKPVFEANLLSLGDTTTITISKDVTTGKFLATTNSIIMTEPPLSGTELPRAGATTSAPESKVPQEKSDREAKQNGSVAASSPVNGASVPEPVGGGPNANSKETVREKSPVGAEDTSGTNRPPPAAGAGGGKPRNK